MSGSSSPSALVVLFCFVGLLVGLGMRLLPRAWIQRIPYTAFLLVYAALISAAPTSSLGMYDESLMTMVYVIAPRAHAFHAPPSQECVVIYISLALLVSCAATLMRM